MPTLVGVDLAETTVPCSDAAGIWVSWDFVCDRMWHRLRDNRAELDIEDLSSSWAQQVQRSGVIYGRWQACSRWIDQLLKRLKRCRMAAQSRRVLHSWAMGVHGAWRAFQESSRELQFLQTERAVLQTEKNFLKGALIVLSHLWRHQGPLSVMKCAQSVSQWRICAQDHSGALGVLVRRGELLSSIQRPLHLASNGVPIESAIKRLHATGIGQKLCIKSP